jgi:hypothetical protein
MAEGRVSFGLLARGCVGALPVVVLFDGEGGGGRCVERVGCCHAHL